MNESEKMKTQRSWEVIIEDIKRRREVFKEKHPEEFFLRCAACLLFIRFKEFKWPKERGVYLKAKLCFRKLVNIIYHSRNKSKNPPAAQEISEDQQLSPEKMDLMWF